MNAARTPKQSSAETVPGMMRALRDANRDDKDLVGVCNRTIQTIKNLQIEEAIDSPNSRDAAKNLRAALAYNMNWLANWKRKKFAVVS